LFIARENLGSLLRLISLPHVSLGVRRAITTFADDGASADLIAVVAVAGRDRRFDRLSSIMSLAEVQKRLEKERHMPFRGLKLTRQDLEWLLQHHAPSTADLPRSFYRWRLRAEAVRLDLRGAILDGEDLSDLSLAYVVFGIVSDDPRLSYAELTSPPVASLRHCFFQNTDLRGADMQRVEAMHADFRDARLDGVDFARAKLAHSRFDRQKLDGAFFHGACLDGASFNDARLRRAIFVQASLSWASFHDADLGQANLADSRMHACNLVRAHLEGASLRNTHLEPQDDANAVDGAILSAAFLDDATDLRGTILARDSDGAAAHLGNVRWNGADITPIDWSNVKLLGEEADVREARVDTTEPLEHVRFTFLGMFVNRKSAEVSREETRLAMLATRQIAALLRSQGLRAPADAFAYRGHRMERRLLREQGRYLTTAASWLLDLFTGYSYRPLRIIGWYLFVVTAWALFYYSRAGGAPTPVDSALLGDAVAASVGALMGRGATPEAMVSGARAAATIEGILGLFFEVSLIIAFTQRAFGR
jgi:uncharacterized protein YjbI with pentapeptide repeats